MKFYYNNAGSPAGPYEKEELAAYGIAPDTLVWHEGLDAWKPANEIAELADFFAPAPEPIQEPETLQTLPPAEPEPQAYGTPVPPAPLAGAVPPPATSGMTTPACPPPTAGTPAPQPYTAAPEPGSPTGAVPPPSPCARPAAPYTPQMPQTPPAPPASNRYNPANTPAEYAAPVDFKSGKGVAVAAIVTASAAMVFGIFSYFIAWIFAVPSLILAILAISKSGNAVKVAAAGNREAAENMARSVRSMSTISIILGALSIITVLLLLTALSVLIYDTVNGNSSYYDPYDYDYDYYESLRMMLGGILRL
ncbi:MAG TPA: hypothetical protein DC009_10615 [Porphyromonadaceae bacterium]|nr:hypothetical protein [Porphyromonadaceae bacterium]